MRVHTPHDLPEALELLASLPGAIPAAGTTDLLPRWHAGRTRPDHLVILTHIPCLRRISVEDDVLYLGALLTHHLLATSAFVTAHVPALSAAALSIGAPAIRNMGTMGGNIANASPAADLPPPLLAHETSLVLSSASSVRILPLHEFFLSYSKVDLQPGEIISEVRIPLLPAHARSFFFKLGTRKAQSIAKVSIAGTALLGRGRVIESIRLAAGSIAPIPLRLHGTESALIGRTLTIDLCDEASRIAMAEVHPIDDVRSTASYRRHAVGVLVHRLLTAIERG